MEFDETTNRDFHTYIGFCITAWAKVEEELFDVCQKCLGTPRTQAAIVYYRTPTLNGRLELVDELVLAALPQRERKSGGHDSAEVKAWRTIKADLADLLKTRSRIAHHPVSVRFRTKGSLGTPAMPELQTSFEIYMSGREQARPRSGGSKPLTVTHLVHHCLHLQKMVERLKTFASTTLRAHLK